MLKRLTSGVAHLRLAPELTAPKEQSQQWRAISDTVSDLTGPRIQPKSPTSIAIF